MTITNEILEKRHTLDLTWNDYSPITNNDGIYVVCTASVDVCLAMQTKADEQNGVENRSDFEKLSDFICAHCATVKFK